MDTSALWPRGFARVPDEDWTRQPVEELALGYDSVENHGWYSNLDYTVEQVGDYARRGDVLIDYSGGTGILAKRLLDRLGAKPVGILIVDSSPKFLRLALEKFRDEPRMAFRRIRYLKEQRRLERVDEVLGGAMLERGVDGLISTNAIHLYFDLPETVRAWRRVLKPSGRVFIQSGNIRNPEMPDDEWIIDETVEVIHRAAVEIVREDERWARYRSALADAGHMAAHAELRRKYFLPVRPLEYYLDILRDEGFEVTSVRRRRIPARVEEWFQFLAVYHEGVLGWVGGAEKISGVPTPPEIVQDRHELMRRAMDRVFGEAFEFGASWTYITCEPRDP
ncbi:MAG: class I SAM-dependent methyltransferase [Gemmatimonadetes bacterium]|nr:MAG: class I SAM-dependent methyltransferase [Gemmatimonadota bacterium]